MAKLSLHLLGPFQVILDGQPVIGFKSNKVRGLLAYLAVESDKLHHRETLAGLLWPEWPDREALSNLRYSLSDLRRTIRDREADPPFLLVTRDSIQFNPASDYWLDVNAFTEGIAMEKNTPSYIDQLEKTASLYRGRFLEGFSLEDSPAFDEWTMLNRERLTRHALSILHTLAETYGERGEYDCARSYAWRQLELEPWDEAAHQQLMRFLALGGQRSAALAQYETCRALLADELGVEPAEETTKLYEHIRDGKLNVPKSSPAVPLDLRTRIPPFLKKEPSHFETPVFVAREQELARLNKLVELALSGQGCVVFVTGEAGSGKTSLVNEFIRRAQDMYADLLVATGNCNAYTGIGDPYLPFREILEFLTGDVESRWAAGAITREHALRLWSKLPIVAYALVDVGPELIDTFIQRSALLERIRSSFSEQSNLLLRLDAFLERKPATALSVAALHQVNLFEQYTRVLQTLQAQIPLLLVIDDLQWADAGSINLLFHLGRSLAGSRILLVGSYRSEEVALGRGGGRHPLEPVINELRRQYGDILLNLGQALGQDEGRRFVEAFLDSEPNRLDDSFRKMLYQQTLGHPLFTIELLRGLQERGDILKDFDGYWVAGPSLDWETLPVRVEAAIQERISRLPEEMQKALEVASIEGELFTAEVVARVRGIDEREILERLSGDLDRIHRLVRAQSIQRVNGQLLSRYQFRHILFQRYLYGRLDEVVRAHLHEHVGKSLEDFYSVEGGTETIAVQLALHFQKARIVDKAVHYLYLAGQKAIQLSAYQEVITHIARALQLLGNLPASPERDQRELDLHLAMALALQGAKGAQLAEVRDVFIRARELCEKLEKKNELVQVLGGLAICYYVRGEYHKARDLAQEALILAETTNNPMLVMLCHWYLGFILLCLGEYEVALDHLRQVTDTYDHKKHHQSFLQLRGSDAGLGAMAYETCCLWCLGYPAQALKLSQKSLELARKLDHPFTLADVICFAGCLFHAMRRDADALATEADALIQVANKASLAGWLATGMRYRGEALVLQGKIQEGATQIKEGKAAMLAEEIGIYISGTLANQVEVQLKAGLLEEARSSLDEAFDFIEKTDERYWEAELFRLKGELLLMDRDVAGAEACLNKAINIARNQKAKSLELRAIMSLCSLWQRLGKRIQAKKILTEIYNWFTEGFDTPDLVEAKALLADLA